MAGLVDAILTQMQSTLVSNINTEKDILDSTIADIDTDFILKWEQNSMPLDFPAIDIYPFGDTVVDSEQANVNTIIPWNIAVRIAVNANSESEAGDELDVWLSSAMYALIKNDGWDLSDVVCLSRLVAWSNTASADAGGTFYKEGLLVFEQEAEYDFST